MNMNFNRLSKWEVHTQQWMSDVHKPWIIWSVHDWRYRSNIQATRDIPIPCPTKDNHCLHAKGDVRRTRLNNAKGCTHSTINIVLPHPISVERYAEATAHASVYDLCRLSNGGFCWYMSCSLKNRGLSWYFMPLADVDVALQMHTPRADKYRPLTMITVVV